MSDFTPIPQIELDAMKAREEAASKGPWERDLFYVCAEVEYGRPGLEVIIKCLPTLPTIRNRKRDDANADFIAHSRTDQPRLRVTLEAAQAHIKELHGEQRVDGFAPMSQEELEERIAELETERDELQQWVHDCQAGMYINCVYCGHRYGPEDEVPVTMADVLKEHIEQCPKHPMSTLKAERDTWKQRAEYAEDQVRTLCPGVLKREEPEEKGDE